jgi:hypothetical protein
MLGNRKRELIMSDRIVKIRRAACSVVLLVAGLPACAGSDTEVITVENSGTLDLSASADELRVRVSFDRCLSSSCDEVQSANCTVSAIDDRIVVSSQLVYTSATDRACTDDCQSGIAECSVPITTPGVYQLTHGLCQSTITMPLPLFLGSRSECGPP